MNPQGEVDRWNERNAVGAPVRYFEVICKDGWRSEPIDTRTRTPAQVLGGHTAVVWLENVIGCVKCSHCEVQP